MKSLARALSLGIFVVLASCRGSQNSDQDTILKDTPQNQMAIQGFRTYCGTCHQSYTQAAGIRDKAVQIKQMLTSNRMPPIGSQQQTALAQQPNIKQAMIAFVSEVTAPISALPLEDIKVPPGFKVSLFAMVPNARSLSVDTCEGGQAIVWVGTGGFSNPDTKIYGVVPNSAHTFATTVKMMRDNFKNPNGIAVVPGSDTLYVADPDKIVKFSGAKQALLNNSLLSTPTTVVGGIPTSFGNPPQQNHTWKYLRYKADEDRLYYSIGSFANVQPRRENPFATIMRVKTNGTMKEIFAQGVRNSIGFDWQPDTNEFWFTDNGRDGLGNNAPADELNKSTAIGEDFGYPYCHAGDTPDPSPSIASQGSCASAIKPKMKLGAHVAALGLRFYWSKSQVTHLTQATPAVFKFPFPESFQGQAFIAEHGSWNSTVPIGARVTLVKLSPDHKSAVSYAPFATGFQRPNGTRWGRPVDVAPYCDGSLLVSDDKAGAIYRITFQP